MVILQSSGTGVKSTTKTVVARAKADVVESLRCQGRPEGQTVKLSRDELNKVNNFPNLAGEVMEENGGRILRYDECRMGNLEDLQWSVVRQHSGKASIDE